MARYSTRDVFFGDYFWNMTNVTLDGMKTPDEQRITADLCEEILKKQPQDLSTLTLLGHLYTDLGDFSDGLDIDRRITRLTPRDPLAWYNLACSYSLLQRTDESVESLEKAIDLGYTDMDYMNSDPDLDSIRGTEQYRELMSRLLSRQTGK